MPNSCAAYGCNSKLGPDTKQKKITFHLLPPPTDSRRKVWISNSRRIDPITRQPWNPSSKYIYFCSEHFMPSDFDNPFGKPSNRKLKDNAVPTVFTFPTFVPPSPEKQSSISNTRETPNPNQVDDTLNKNKVVSRSKKSKHRKVVMLPKKIKLLQETSAANVESVTIISFQHLDYDEKMQAMFEEAKLDLQYSDQSECEPEEDEGEYYDDEYTELQSLIPFDDDEAELISNLKIISSKKPIRDKESLDVSSSNVEKNIEDVKETDRHSEKIVTETLGDVDITDKSDHNQDASKTPVEGAKSDDNKNVETDNQSGILKGLQTESGEKKTQRRKKKASKRKIPVVIKELILIDDIEELRIKAFRIAEDNIKLKRQVIYLEKKIEEIVSQVYTK